MSDIKIFRSSDFDNRSDLEKAVQESLDTNPEYQVSVGQGDGFYDLVLVYNTPYGTSTTGLGKSPIVKEAKNGLTESESFIFDRIYEKRGSFVTVENLVQPYSEFTGHESSETGIRNILRRLKRDLRILNSGFELANRRRHGYTILEPTELLGGQGDSIEYIKVM